MINSELELLIMQLIMNSGNAKSLAMEAVQFARKNQLDLAKKTLEEADESMTVAHEIQTQLLVTEARGENYQFSLLLTHSQDHLMNALNAIDMAKEMVFLWESVHTKG